MTMLAEQRKFIVMISVATVLFLIWLFGFHLSLNRQYKRTYSEMTVLENKNNEIQSLESQLNALLKRRSKSEEDLLTILKRIPRKELYSETVSMVRVLASEHNLEVSAFNPSAIPIESDSTVAVSGAQNLVIEKYPIDVSLVGDYLDFGLFLDDFEKLPYLYTLSNLLIEPVSTEDSLSLNMVIYAYMQSEG